MSASVARKPAWIPLVSPRHGTATDEQDLILLGKQHCSCGPVCFCDYPQLLPSGCLVAAQQAKPMSHAELVLRDIGRVKTAQSPPA